MKRQIGHTHSDDIDFTTIYTLDGKSGVIAER